MKIITAAAVSDSNGNVVCATPVAFSTISQNVNSNAQAYWGTSVLGVSSAPLGLTTISDSNIFNVLPVTTTFFVDSKTSSINTDTPLPSGVTVTLPTPFVYLPSGCDGDVGLCSFTGAEEYGYPPQTLLDFMGSNAAVISQYPNFKQCVPAGPSLIKFQVPASFVIPAAAPVVQQAGGDLTVTTTMTVSPSTAPLHVVGSIISATPPSPASAFTTPPGPTATSPLPGTPPQPQLSGTPASSSIIPPVDKAPGSDASSAIPTSNLQNPVQNTPIPPSVPSPTPDNNPSLSATFAPQPVLQSAGNSAPSTLVSSASSAITSPSTNQAAIIASAIASGIGAAPIVSPTVVSGTTDVVVGGQTTVVSCHSTPTPTF